MQWNAGPNAGFCAVDVEPWLPVHANRETVNVQDQLQDEDSLLNLYRALLRLRRDSPALQTGSLALVDDPTIDDQILAYTRSHPDQTIFVALNFGTTSAECYNQTGCQHILLSNGLEPPANRSYFWLPPFSGILLSS
jgi:alpha-glucosidase